MGQQVSVPEEESSSSCSADDVESGPYKFVCDICLDSCPVNTAIRVDNCDHSFCCDCIKDHFEYHVSLHKIRVPCPGMVIPKEAEDPNDIGDSRTQWLKRKKPKRQESNNSSTPSPCPQVLSTHLLERALTQSRDGEDEESSLDNTKLWKKYQRLVRLESDSSLATCTRCDEIVPSPQSVDHKRTCPNCQHVFCAIHGDADIDNCCRSASKENLPCDVKPCSHCQAPIHKSGGCDHIVCPLCDMDMCFKCGTHEYLTGQMMRYCSQCQQGFLDHRYLSRLRCLYCGIFVMIFPGFVLYGAFALLFVVLSGCCCGFYSCGAGLHRDGRLDCPRGVAMVGSMIVLPILYMLLDAGIHWQWLLEVRNFVETGYVSVAGISESSTPVARDGERVHEDQETDS